MSPQGSYCLCCLGSRFPHSLFLTLPGWGMSALMKHFLCAVCVFVSSSLATFSALHRGPREAAAQPH